VAGVPIISRNFGQTTLSRISGRVFNDKNGDGRQTAGEGPLAGRVVYIDTNNNGKLDAGERQTITAADGSYVFNGLSAGNYIIREIAPAGWTNVSADSRITLRLQPAVVIGGLLLGQRRK